MSQSNNTVLENTDTVIVAAAKAAGINTTFWSVYEGFAQSLEALTIGPAITHDLLAPITVSLHRDVKDRCNWELARMDLLPVGYHLLRPFKADTSVDGFYILARSAQMAGWVVHFLSLGLIEYVSTTTFEQIREYTSTEEVVYQIVLRHAMDPSRRKVMLKYVPVTMDTLEDPALWFYKESEGELVLAAVIGVATQGCSFCEVDADTALTTGLYFVDPEMCENCGKEHSPA